MDMASESDLDKSESWVGAAYVVLIAANVAVTYYELRGTSVLAPFEARVQRWRRRASAYLIRPWHDPARWRRMVTEVVVEAWVATEGEKGPQ